MDVKSLYPIIVTDNPEQTIRFYENLGFELRQDSQTLMNSRVYVLVNNDIYDDMEIEVVEAPKDGPMKLTPGLYGFRMNVADIDEAYENLKASGCTIIMPPTETAAGRNMLIKDEQGINIILVQYDKEI